MKSTKLAAMLVVTIATTFDLSVTMPLRCDLALNPSAIELQNYRLCVGERLMRGKDLNFVDDYDAMDTYEDDNTGRQSDKFIDTLANEEVQTFPHCIGLLEHECRALLGSLEELGEALGSFDYRRRRKRSLSYERRSADNDKQELLERYEQWRTDNGYGKSVGRWGRSDDEHVPRTRMLTTLTNHRAKRTDSNSDEALLNEYKNWRDEHGYGKATGRWG